MQVIVSNSSVMRLSSPTKFSRFMTGRDLRGVLAIEGEADCSVDVGRIFRNFAFRAFRLSEIFHGRSGIVGLLVGRNGSKAIT